MKCSVVDNKMDSTAVGHSKDFRFRKMGRFCRVLSIGVT